MASLMSRSPLIHVSSPFPHRLNDPSAHNLRSASYPSIGIHKYMGSSIDSIVTS